MRSARTPSACALAAILFGCTSADAERVEPPAPAAKVPDAVAVQPVDAPVEIRAHPSGPAVLVPPDYVPLADHEIERLRLASLRRTPHASAEVVGRKSPRGLKYGMSVAMAIASDDLPSIYGETVRGAASSAIERGKQEATGLGPTAAPTFTLEPHDAARHVDLLITMETPDGGQLRTRSRFWVGADGTYHEDGCMCSGPGCAFDREGCILPEPGAGALDIDTPIHGDRPPASHALAGGAVTVDVPGIFTRLPAERLRELQASERDRHPRRAEVEVDAHVGPRDDTGVVFLQRATWCAGSPPTCTAAEVVDELELAVRVDSEAMAIRPEIARKAEVKNGKEAIVLEARSADLSWERHLVWSSDAAILEVSCMCGGQACATVERTCELRPET